MLSIIKLLPEHVANQIAAGEVIQRPASVVKELLDNSMDAESTFITLSVKDGGRTLVQVADNGAGMSELDARMAWERHATSKISKAEDLFGLNTMGFRGEALASIASVSHVEMKTRRHADEVGSRIVVEGSELKLHEPVSTQPGTVISVKNLFYNVPARRNFLKSNPVETKYVFDEFIRAALARPDIGFKLINNEQEVFNLPAASMGQRILDIYPDKKKDNLLEAGIVTDLIQVKGFAGSPDTARKNRGEQFLFVNGRYFKHPFINHAVMSAYDELIPKDNFPLYVLHLLVNPGSIDVNVHPQKTEIKFEDEKMIYQVVRSVVKQAIGRYLRTPDADFNTSFLFQTEDRKDYTPPPKSGSQPSFNPFAGKPQDKEWKKMFDPYLSQPFGERFERTETATIPQIVQVDSPTVPQFSQEETVQVFQLFGSHIVAITPANTYIINQQLAHERILYERYMDSSGKRPPVQEKLFPRLVEMSPPDFELLNELLDELNGLGFDISVFGKNTIIINGTPADIRTVNEQDLLEGILNEYKNNLSDLKDKRHENIARSASKRAGIKAGIKLAQAEMEQLVRQLFACETKAYSPQGLPVMCRMNVEDLERLMGK